MDFDFSDDQKALKDHARRFLEEQSSRDVVRAVLDGGSGHDPSLWRSVAEMGLPGTAIPDQYGGLGLGYLELCVIAEELGGALAPAAVSPSFFFFGAPLLLGGGGG